MNTPPHGLGRLPLWTPVSGSHPAHHLVVPHTHNCCFYQTQIKPAALKQITPCSTVMSAVWKNAGMPVTLLMCNNISSLLRCNNISSHAVIRLGDSQWVRSQQSQHIFFHACLLQPHYGPILPWLCVSLAARSAVLTFPPLNRSSVILNRASHVASDQMH